MAKATDAEIELRIDAVLTLIVGGASRAEILQYAAKEAKWDCKTRQVDECIARATERLKEAAAVNRDEQLGLAITRLRDLYQRCLKIQDYKAALAVQKELHALLGLSAPVRIDVRKLDDEIERRLAGLAGGGQAPAAP